MKAIIHTRYGNLEVLRVTTLERPAQNEVLIRVMVARRGEVVLRLVA